MSAEQRLEFTLPGPPIAWHRAEPSFRKGERRKHPEDKAYQAAIGLSAKAAIARWKQATGGSWSLDGEWVLEVEAFVHNRIRRDASNILKNVEDGMSKIVYKDDALVVDSRCIKRLSKKNPRTIVKLHRVHGYMVDESQGVLGLPR